MPNSFCTAITQRFRHRADNAITDSRKPCSSTEREKIVRRVTFGTWVLSVALAPFAAQAELIELSDAELRHIEGTHGLGAWDPGPTFIQPRQPVLRISSSWTHDAEWAAIGFGPIVAPPFTGALSLRDSLDPVTLPPIRPFASLLHSFPGLVGTVTGGSLSLAGAHLLALNGQYILAR